jgi:hypothetical protein
VAYNYGASRPERIRGSVRWAMVYSFAFFVPFLLVLELAPAAVLQLFNASENMLAIGRPALRLLTLGWLISIPNLVVAASLQGHIQRRRGCLFPFVHIAVDIGNTHGYGQGEAVVTNTDFHDVIQDGKVVRNTAIQHLRGEDGQVLVSVVLAEHTVHALHPSGQRFFDEIGGGTVVRPDELGQLLQVIQHDIG